MPKAEVTPQNYLRVALKVCEVVSKRDGKYDINSNGGVIFGAGGVTVATLIKEPDDKIRLTCNPSIAEQLKQDDHGLFIERTGLIFQEAGAKDEVEKQNTGENTALKTVSWEQCLAIQRWVEQNEGHIIETDRIYHDVRVCIVKEGKNTEPIVINKIGHKNPIWVLYCSPRITQRLEADGIIESPEPLGER